MLLLFLHAQRSIIDGDLVRDDPRTTKGMVLGDELGHVFLGTFQELWRGRMGEYLLKLDLT